MINKQIKQNLKFGKWHRTKEKESRVRGIGKTGSYNSDRVTR